MSRLAMLCTGALAVSACNQQAATDEPANQANAVNAAAEAPAYEEEIRDAAGKVVGLLSYEEGDPDGLPLTIRVHDLPPGIHGMHLHEVGKCEGPGFASAGAHWNPAGRQHGADNPQGRHAGDLPNVMLEPDGLAKVEYLIPKGSGDHPQGLALVIHADPDDGQTDPSGNSGERIACAVLFPAPN